MHIALLSPSWPMHHHPNGIVTYVGCLREELMRQGHRVSILTPRVAPGCADPQVHALRASAWHRLAVRLFRVGGRPLPEVFAWGRVIAAKLGEIHAADPIDVVEMEESYGWCADVARRVPMPVVAKLHGPAFLSLVDEELEMPGAQDKIAAEGEALRQMKAITSPSANTLAQTIARYRLAPPIAELVPNPMSVPADVPLWSREGCEPRTLLFVGRFDKRKGGDTVLLAFRRLLEQWPDARLVFVGPDVGLTRRGERRLHFEDFCAGQFTAGQRQRIDYRGALPREQIFALRVQAAAVLIASRWDNQPNTALEAMMQGCPVVAVDSGGVDELIEHGHSGLLAKAGDIDDLCARMGAMLGSPDAAAAMGRRAREAVLQRHAMPALAAQTLAVYRRAIAAHDANRRPRALAQ